MLETGEKYVIETVVSEERLAVNVGSGDLRVLATPAVAALMEQAAAALAKKDLPEGMTTVGSELNIKHLSPTPLGAALRVEAKLTSREGRVYGFRVEAYDPEGLIAEGTHTRVSVNAERFQEKADGKNEKV